MCLWAMNIQQRITLLRLVIHGYFQQRAEAKRNAAECIFALADEIEDYIRQKIPDADRVWCLSVTSEIKDQVERFFREPQSNEKPSELDTLLGKLIRVGHIGPKDDRY